MLFRSHILAELDEYSTHMLVLRGGKVIENRALSETQVNGVSGRRLRVTLAEARDGWTQSLEGFAGVNVIESDALQGVLAVTGDAAQQALALRLLIEAGVPVAAFAKDSENLHDSYLRTVQQSDTQGAST